MARRRKEACSEVTQLASSFTFGLQTLGIAHSKAFLGVFCPPRIWCLGIGWESERLPRLRDKALKARSDYVGFRQKKQLVQKLDI